MPLTRPIPPEALPIAEILRRDVARPDPDESKLMESPFDKGAKVIRWATEPAYACLCPMGMHPDAQSPLPSYAEEFPACEDAGAVDAFGTWFDEQTDPHAAVEAIWGKAER
jgi:hypothetical protein